MLRRWLAVSLAVLTLAALPTSSWAAPAAYCPEGTHWDGFLCLVSVDVPGGGAPQKGLAKGTGASCTHQGAPIPCSNSDG